jgi:lysozyme
MKNNHLAIWLIGGAVVLWLLSRYTQTGANIVQSISDAGLKLIAQFEGFSDKAYNDPPGSDKFSIGFGHQIQPGEESLLTSTITVDQGRTMLAQDTANAQAVVRSTITYPLTPQQFDALTSFVYNIGASAFKSGTVPAKINAGDFASAAATMKQYDKIHDPSGNLVVSTVLASRRAVEASAFA